MLIHRIACRLDHEHIRATHVLQDLHVPLAILKTLRHCLPRVHAQMLADFMREFGVSRAGEDLELLIDTALRFALAFRLRLIVFLFCRSRSNCCRHRVYRRCGLLTGIAWFG